MTNAKAHRAGFMHISARLGGVMPTSVWGKASVAAGWFLIARYVTTRIGVFKWGSRGEKNCFPDIFYCFQALKKNFVAIPTMKTKPERPIKNLVCC